MKNFKVSLPGKFQLVTPYPFTVVEIAKIETTLEDDEKPSEILVEFDFDTCEIEIDTPQSDFIEAPYTNKEYRFLKENRKLIEKTIKDKAFDMEIDLDNFQRL